MKLLGSGSETPDPELITRTREGDVEAYSELFDRHRDAALRLARRLARRPSDVDDLVAEAFVRVMEQLREGKGPSVSFRGYLLMTLRHLASRSYRDEQRATPTDDDYLLDQPVEGADPVESMFDSTAVSRAFGALPELWQTILWHLEVEKERPAQVAKMLGMSANHVSVVAYRAREALRQGYLLEHAAEVTDTACTSVIALLPAQVRGKLSRRDKALVEAHLPGCLSCTAALSELTQINSSMSAVLAPALLGAGGAAYAASASGAGQALRRHRNWLALIAALGIFRRPRRLAALVLALVALGGSALALLHADAGPVPLTEAIVSPAPTPPALTPPPATPAPPSGAPTPSGSPTAPSSPSNAATSVPAPPSSTAAPVASSAAQTTAASASASTSSEPAVVPPIRASILAAPSGLRVTLIATASGGEGSLRYRWHFGDGSTGAKASLTHTYAKSGSYRVRLRVTDGTRHTTVARTVSVYAVNQTPIAALSTSTDAELTVTASAAASTDPDGSIVAYAWDFGDGADGTGQTVSHTYASAGDYAVRLTVTDNRGGRASKVSVVTVG